MRLNHWLQRLLIEAKESRSALAEATAALKNTLALWLTSIRGILWWYMASRHTLTLDLPSSKTCKNMHDIWWAFSTCYQIRGSKWIGDESFPLVVQLHVANIASEELRLVSLRYVFPCIRSYQKRSYCLQSQRALDRQRLIPGLPDTGWSRQEASDWTVRRS